MNKVNIPLPWWEGLGEGDKDHPPSLALPTAGEGIVIAGYGRRI